MEKHPECYINASIQQFRGGLMETGMIAYLVFIQIKPRFFRRRCDNGWRWIYAYRIHRIEQVSNTKDYFIF